MENTLLQKWSQYSKFIKVSNNFEVEYTVANNSIHAIEPEKAIVSTGYDLFAAEEKTLSPKCVTSVTTEIEMEIPCGYFGKIYRRSDLLKKYFLSCDGGLIDSDFRGSVLILMTNNSSEPFEVKHGQRIAQIILDKKDEVTFRKVESLSSTERGARGFGSTGI